MSPSTGEVAPSVEMFELASAVRAEVARSLALEESTATDPLRARAAFLVQRALDGLAAARVQEGRAPLRDEEEQVAHRLALDMLFGLGMLQRFVDDPEVENVDANGCDRVFVTYGDGRKVRVGAVASSDEELVAIVRSAAARFGLSERRFDAAQPELDLRLPDGSRLSAVMAVTERPVVDIRRHRLADLDLRALVSLGALDEELAALLSAAVRAKRNVLVSGAMNSGKTTLLRALAAEIPPEERIVTIEQSLELGLDRQGDRHPDCVAMEARLANTEGEGAVTMAQLVRRSLRMNASRVIVGEVLGDEIIPMLNAMSQGRSGSMGTIHADSSAGVFRRIAAYAVQSPERLPLEASNLLIAGAIHYVVHLDASPGTGGMRRHVASVREVVDAEGALVISNEIWRPGPDGSAVPAAPLGAASLRALAETGYQPVRRARP
ncbi:MAG TPA: ATPase, T2SS/T4P/T4SS family [Acidimicrobiales bacterium]|nr:ATPase, T2SS/T4P/T4SS family [Acidimicrobiales bacterium]